MNARAGGREFVLQSSVKAYGKFLVECGNRFSKSRERRQKRLDPSIEVAGADMQHAHRSVSRPLELFVDWNQLARHPCAIESMLRGYPRGRAELRSQRSGARKFTDRIGQRRRATRRAPDCILP